MPDRPRLSADELLDNIRRLTLDLAQAESTDEVLWTIARSTRMVLGYDDCVIYFVDPERRTLTQRAAHGPKSPDGVVVENPLELRFGQGIVGRCAEIAEPVLVEDTRLDESYIVDDAQRGSELAVPVIDNGEVIAVIDSEHACPGFYTLGDQNALCDIAAISAARLRAAQTIEALERSVAQLEQARRQLDELANSDRLTGLLNRRGFESLVPDDTDPDPVAVALLDIDRFKAVNDGHGHRCGDEVLRQLSTRIQRRVEGSDIQAARLGGDEFALIGRDPRSMQQIILSIIADVRAGGWRTDSAPHEITISAGMAGFARIDRLGHAHRPAGGVDVWAQADEALYLAKANGRDQLVVYDELDPNLIELHADRQWADTVSRAIADDSLILYGQPIVSAHNPHGPVQHLEVLLRYRSDDGQILPPGRLLTAAERFGLSERLDLWVVERTISWLATHPDTLEASVNVTSAFLASQRALGRLGRLLDDAHVDPKRLCIELTETMAIHDLKRTEEFVRTAHRWGCRIAIDDFGNGWTSLPLVRDLGVDRLKIDGSWIQSATTDRLSRSVVSAIAEAAAILEVETVAEWVDDDETVRFLQELGVPYLQGFLTGVPAPLPVADDSRASAPSHSGHRS